MIDANTRCIPRAWYGLALDRTRQEPSHIHIPRPSRVGGPHDACGATDRPDPKVGDGIER